MSKPLDLLKPVVTRAGRSARIICTDRKGSPGNFEVIALVLLDSGREVTVSCTRDGKSSGDSRLDLVQKTTKKWRWAYNSGLFDHSIVSEKHFTEAEAQARYGATLIGKIVETQIEE